MAKGNRAGTYISGTMRKQFPNLTVEIILSHSIYAVFGIFVDLARGIEESFYILCHLGRLTSVSDDLLEIFRCVLVLPDQLLVYG